MASCNKCRGPAESVVTCDLCGKAYARCSSCGGGAGARRSLKSHKGLYGEHGPEDGRPPLALHLPPGTRVKCEYRDQHEGTVLAKNDPRVWRGSLAFPADKLPDQAAVSRHVAHCQSMGLLNDSRQPVLWDFGKIYWDSKLEEVDDARQSA